MNYSTQSYDITAGHGSTATQHVAGFYGVTIKSRVVQMKGNTLFIFRMVTRWLKTFQLISRLSLSYVTNRVLYI